MPCLPPQLSCTLPGVRAWTAATLVGCQTAASATPSVPQVQSAVEEELGFTPCMSTQARLASPAPTPDMMPTVTEVGPKIIKY